jgi:alkanesulfonate monooxygenase SsuD/methylene tetrahydromethanopterin reductase-like flavin-dependent oxidoreductase (luciferase family)
MSDGRVELGLGAGWFDAEHRAYAIPFPDLKERLERLEEQLEIIQGLWTTPLGATYSFSGRHYELQDSPALPKPLQSPHPPVVIGGIGTSRTPRLAARFAQEYNAPFLQPSHAAEQYRRVDEACGELGRDPATIRHTFAVTTCCGTSEKDAERRALAGGWKAEDLRVAGACGTPQEVADRLDEWRQVGAEAAYLQLLDPTDLEHIELLGAAVASLL